MIEVEFKNEPGWVGGFTRHQAPGALANGTRISKVMVERSDGHPHGTKGTVLGSICHPEVMDGAFLYFVEWDPHPRTAVAVMGNKIAEFR